MDIAIAGRIIAGWIVLSSFIHIGYWPMRKENKGFTWAELALCLFFVPGLLVAFLAFLIVTLVRHVWELFDRPIKKRRE